MTTCAILFARTPAAGRVKTRLLTALSGEQAARLYEAFLLDTAALLRASGAGRKVVAVADAAGVPRLRDLLDPDGGTFDLVEQAEGGLGERMAAALEGAFACGAERALVMGTDSPSLPGTTIDDALERLSRRDVVFGPVVDGGYYLVGVRATAFGRVREALFGDGIPWSSGTVLARSVERLPAGTSLSLLPPWYDVDHPQEAHFLRDHLQALARAGQPVAPRSLAALRGLSLPEPG